MKRPRTFIIAEAGVNHNGSLKMALRLVDAAKKAGADAVKFQTFKSEAVISRFAKKAEYQIRTTGKLESQLEMVKKLELDLPAHRALLRRSIQSGILFLSTPFDEPSVDLLVRHLDLSILKIPSGEISNGPLLLKIARTGKPVILSTGMSTLNDIKLALSVLAYGYLSVKQPPSRRAFSLAFRSPKTLPVLKKQVTLLHCTTEYPCPYSDVNLLAMDVLSKVFGLSVGLSDHSLGISIPVAAVALGATVIEKHLTLDRCLSGPDHKASLEPGEFTAMVRAIRETELALGVAKKCPAPSELKNRPIARKSLVASCVIQKGERFTPVNITCKRPGNGLSPMKYWEIIGKKAMHNLLPDEPL